MPDLGTQSSTVFFSVIETENGCPVRTSIATVDA